MQEQKIPHSSRSFQRVLEAAGLAKVDYVEPANLNRWLTTSDTYPLFVISFGSSVVHPLPCPLLTLDLPELDTPRTLEVWSSDQPARFHRAGGFSAAVSGSVLAGSICLEEEPDVGLALTTNKVYRRLLAHIREMGFPYLWRIWNYFPRMNVVENGLERYRQFCVGRHQALSESLSNFPASLPAGTAVGTQSGPLQIYVLAGSHPATPLGNPRQLDAYLYPKQYGPRSPSFARATICRSESGSQLFIAGTASVVGHDSRHIGLPEEQAKETVRNLRALIEHADNGFIANETRTSNRAFFKIYVRNVEQFSIIRQSLRDPLLTSSRLLFLKGDLCRRELLVEIEGLITAD